MSEVITKAGAFALLACFTHIFDYLVTRSCDNSSTLAVV